MSVRAVEWAIYEADIPSDGPDHGARLVLIALADSANRDTHIAWLGMRRLALATRRSEDQARRYVQHLERLGLIADVGGLPDDLLPPAWRAIRADRRPRIYRLTVDEQDPAARGGMDAGSHGSGLAPDGSRGGMNPPHGVASDARGTIGTRRTDARASARENHHSAVSSAAPGGAATTRDPGGARNALTPDWDPDVAARGIRKARAALAEATTRREAA